MTDIEYEARQLFKCMARGSVLLVSHTDIDGKVKTVSISKSEPDQEWNRKAWSVLYERREIVELTSLRNHSRMGWYELGLPGQTNACFACVQ